MCVTPRSSARWIVRIDSSSSRPPPVVYTPAIVIAPRPIRDTANPPSDTCFIVRSSRRVDSSQPPSGAPKESLLERVLAAHPCRGTGHLPLRHGQPRRGQGLPQQIGRAH